MHTFFAELLWALGEVVTLDRRDEEHLFRTLRARPGEEVRLFDGAGRAALGRVRDRTVIAVAELPVVRPAVTVHLYTATPRKNRMDQLLSQIAEVGVATLTPVEFARSVAMPEEPPERWRVRMIEGCKQSGNPWVPEIGAPVAFAALPELLRKRGISGFFGDIGGAAGIPVGIPSEVAWVVGPEGGFTPEEVEAMREAGWTGVCIGSYVMRLETAAVTGAALLMAAGVRK